MSEISLVMSKLHHHPSIIIYFQYFNHSYKVDEFVVTNL